MYLKTILFIVFSTNSSFSLLYPVYGYITEQSRGPGKYFSSFRHSDVKDPSEWTYNQMDDQRPITNQFKPPNSYIDGRTSNDKLLRASDGDHQPRISKMLRPYNGLVKSDDLDELLLDRGVPDHDGEYDNDYDSGTDIQRGRFNVYFPDGRPQNINFEGKILRNKQY